MRRTGWAVLFALLVACHPAYAASTSPLLACSAELEARADWMDATRGNSVASETLHDHAGLLLAAYREALGPQDWGMSTGFEVRDSVLAQRDDLALDALTQLAEDNPQTTYLPVCMEDETCIRCTGMLRK